MKRITTIMGIGLSVALFCVSTLAAADKPPMAQDVAPKVIDAWKKANAGTGWYGPGAFGTRLFFEAKPNGLPALFVFRLQTFKPGVIANLPAPSVPFALTLDEMTDAGMK